ncbi:hypothetical protein SAPIO_CDS0185 [Scedosporium apiospermum]|uniref:Peptidase A1 domain-containing protein n=1 Tax=Pseudallescheria apiosperma TaxID=563466 RepID=A0A084GHQ0_PSEDA|nr:uncharacterized protein SAPIO_CDS0185 [Scedosporium apiospermum]KEZ46862.1 hypothetical protein SAPIO_CDS0185 [Scedosporium apiospermum]
MFFKQPLKFDLAYAVDIGIGTPPKRFRMKVDISSPDTYVDDVAQSEKTTCAGHSFYDGQDSSTFHTNGTHLEVEIEPRLNVSGIAAKDVFHLGPFRISD